MNGAEQIPPTDRRCEQCDHHRDYYDGQRLCVAGVLSRLVEGMIAADGACGPTRMLWRRRPQRKEGHVSAT